MKETALHDVHARLGAKLIEFGGWHMPVQYGPILEEVECVRTKAGLFDLGHMGRVHVTGKDALRFVDSIATNYCAKIPIGAIRYSLFCRENGNPIDDILLYREDGGNVFIVVNASNCVEDVAWMRAHARGFDVKIEDQTDALGMIAIQGQTSRDVLQKIVEGYDLAQLGYYKFTFATVCGIADMRVSRTGYTGELGYELYVPQRETVRVWNALTEAGKSHGVRAIGLGARDILRLEAGMPLYGHEIDATHNPIEAGLDFGVSFAPEKGDWIGRAALEKVKANKKHRLVGITSDGPRVPRQGAPLFKGAEQVGYVCSGAPSPTIHKNIASAYVDLGLDRAGVELEIDFKGKRQACTVQELPFFSRTRK